MQSSVEESHCIIKSQGRKGQAFDMDLFLVNVKNGIGSRLSIMNIQHYWSLTGVLMRIFFCY